MSVPNGSGAMGIVGAVVGGFMTGGFTVLMWKLKDGADRRDQKRRALRTFEYFAQCLADALPHPPDTLSHIDASMINAAIPELTAEANFDVAVAEVHQRYLRWKMGAYTGLLPEQKDLMAARRCIEQHAINARQAAECLR